MPFTKKTISDDLILENSKGKNTRRGSAISKIQKKTQRMRAFNNLRDARILNPEKR